jgi:signal recognition particle subunit SRP54
MSRPQSLSFGEFAVQLREMRKMGSVAQLLQMLPKSVSSLAGEIDAHQMEAEFDNIDLLAAVMTPEELRDPEFVPDEARARRLADQAEVPVRGVVSLFQQLEALRRFIAGEEPPSN